MDNLTISASLGIKILTFNRWANEFNPHPFQIISTSYKEKYY